MLCADEMDLEGTTEISRMYDKGGCSYSTFAHMGSYLSQGSIDSHHCQAEIQIMRLDSVLDLTHDVDATSFIPINRPYVGR